jgi:hypothetical protein
VARGKGCVTAGQGCGHDGGVRRAALVGGALVLVVLVVVSVLVGRTLLTPPPGCTSSGADARSTTLEQADSAATIAGVGMALGVPNHAVTVALATAMQESGLRNLPGGDRDSAGLFQQRPSQGWGTYAQVTDPVYAATAFYRKLETEPGWQTMSVTQAAQLVQRSAAPEAYAQWEPQARSLARALTGEDPAGMTCRGVAPTAPGEDVARLAARELGTSRLSGPQPQSRGWAVAGWLVAHADRLALTAVTYDGRTWTASGGTWATTGPADGTLSLRRASNGA